METAEQTAASVHTGSLIFLLIALVVFLLLYSGSKRKYAHYVEPLDPKKFPLKSLLSVGFYAMGLLRYRYHLKFDRRLRRQLAELYDEEFAEYYLQAHWAGAATYAVVGLNVTALFLLATEGDMLGLFLGAVATFIVIWSFFRSVQRQIDERHTKIRLVFPDVLNQLVILSGAGLTLRAAWLKIARDMPADTPLHTEMRKVAEQMEQGVSDLIALDNMGNRCGMPEMRRFISMMVQNFQRGGSDVLYAMEGIGKELWDGRKAAAKRAAEEAGTRLLFPMMLMLLAVIMLVVTPAILSLNVVN